MEDMPLPDKPEPSDDTDRKMRENLRQVKAMTIGMSMVLAMVLCAGVGYWIDRRSGGGVFWTICGIFLGLAYCGYLVWDLARMLSRKD